MPASATPPPPRRLHVLEAQQFANAVTHPTAIESHYRRSLRGKVSGERQKLTPAACPILDTSRCNGYEAGRHWALWQVYNTN